MANIGFSPAPHARLPLRLDPGPRRPGAGAALRPLQRQPRPLQRPLLVGDGRVPGDRARGERLSRLRARNPQARPAALDPISGELSVAGELESLENAPKRAREPSFKVPPTGYAQPSSCRESRFACQLRCHQHQKKWTPSCDSSICCCWPLRCPSSCSPACRCRPTRSAAVAWLLARGVRARRRAVDEERPGRRRPPNGRVGLTAASSLGRAWLIVLAVLLVGLLVDRDAGLAAAVLALSSSASTSPPRDHQLPDDARQQTRSREQTQ